MTQYYISLNSMENILREAGAKRVAHAAKKKLREEVEAYALDIAKQSLTFTSHAGRQTVKESDINAVSKL